MTDENIKRCCSLYFDNLFNELRRQVSGSRSGEGWHVLIDSTLFTSISTEEVKGALH